MRDNEFDQTAFLYHTGFPGPDFDFTGFMDLGAQLAEDCRQSDIETHPRIVVYRKDFPDDWNVHTNSAEPSRMMNSCGIAEVYARARSVWPVASFDEAQLADYVESDDYRIYYDVCEANAPAGRFVHVTFASIRPGMISYHGRRLPEEFVEMIGSRVVESNQVVSSHSLMETKVVRPVFRAATSAVPQSVGLRHTAAK